MALRDEAAPDLLDTPAAGPAAIRGGALRASGYGAGLLLALGSAPLIFRHLGVSEFGRYSAVLALITLAAGFTEGGINAIAQREWATAPVADRERLMANLLGMRIALTLIAVCGALIFALAAGYDSRLIAGTALAGAGMLSATIQSLLASPLQADLRFGWATTADLLRQIVLVACIVGLIVAGAGLVPLLAAQVPAGLAALALTVVLVRGSVPLRPRADWQDWRRLLRATAPYAVAIALNIAYFRVAILYLSIAASSRETGYFATSFRIVEVIALLPPVLLGAAFPVLARAARDDAHRFAYASRRTVEAALILGGAAVVGLELGAEPAVRLLAGSEFLPAVPILRIQAPALLATFAAVALSFPLLSLHRTRDVLLINAAAMAVTLIGLVALVAPHGARGAAIATLAAELALMVAAAVLFARAKTGAPLPLGTFAWVLAAAGAGLAVALVPGVPAAVDVVAGCLLYVGVLAAAGRIPRELIDAVRR